MTLEHASSPGVRTSALLYLKLDAEGVAATLETAGAPDKRLNRLTRAFTSITRYRDYRLVWMGSWAEHLGEWMEMTALLWVVNEMTNSPFMGTLTITLRFLPMVVFAFVGGVAADRMDRRRLLICALLASAASSIVLAVVVHVGAIQVWHILVYSGLSGIMMSFNHPARQTLIPNLVRREHYLNALTLDNASVMASRIVGTPLAGVMIGLVGTAPILGLRAAGALMAVFWLSRVRAPATPAGAERRNVIRDFTDGMGYVWRDKPMLSQVLLYLLPVFVTSTYGGLLPYFATNHLGVGADLYGILNAAPGLGAIVAVLFLASLVNFQQKGLFLLLGGILQGVGLIVFAYASPYQVSLLLLVFIGAANTTFMTLNNTMIQEMASDRMRGRVMALREVAYGLGPAGSLISGAVAAVIGVPLALSAAGVLSIMVLLTILIAFPRTRGRH